MIDLHSHIIADNAITNETDVDWDSVLNVARMALEDGIEHIVWTPEYNVGLINDSDLSKSELLLNAINLKLLEAGFPLVVTLGADFHLALNERPIISSEISKVSNGQYVLLSFSQVYLPSNFEATIRHLLEKGYVPIIAHPERYSWINEKFHLIRDLIDDGAWIQITADSFTGYFGRKAQYWAERLLSEGVIHIIASEAHSGDRRPPVLSEAKHIIEANLNKNEAHKIMRIRPQLIVDNQLCALDLLPPGVNLSWKADKVS